GWLRCHPDTGRNNSQPVPGARIHLTAVKSEFERGFLTRAVPSDRPDSFHLTGLLPRPAGCDCLTRFDESIGIWTGAGPDQWHNPMPDTIDQGQVHNSVTRYRVRPLRPEPGLWNAKREILPGVA